MSALLPFCFAISGAAALALEMLWMRSATLVFGQTAATTAVVLAVYFAGLGLGAAAARAIRDRAARVYGMLELGAAAGALWSLAVFRLLATDDAQAWSNALGWPGRIGALALALLPATLCFGATLPAIGQALARGALGWRGSLLYALNTLGGAAGIAAAGFGLPLLLGVRTSYLAAAATSAAAGTLALAIAARMPSESGNAGERSSVEPEASPRRRLRLVAAGTGALALALEVLWTRLFAQVLHNSVYSFTAVALVFIVAIALGAAAAALLLRRFSPAGVAGAALLFAALATVGGVWTFVAWTDGLAYVGMHSGLGEYIARIVALAAVTAGPAAFASGVVLPALWVAWGGDGAARPLGDLSAANTLGGIAGSLGAAFVGLPLLGLRECFLLAGVGYVVLADSVEPRAARLRPLAYAVLLALVVFSPGRAPIVHLRPEGETLRASAEGPSGIATVVESDGDRQLRLDNYYVLGGSAAAANERRLGLVPLLIHPHPRRAAFIGLATGITASAGPALGVDETTVVELVPEVAELARAHFGTWNADLLGRPDVHLVVGDGRRYLAATRESFDVIVADLFIPWHAGAGSLYSREMYETVARRLAPDGIFCQWLPLYQLTREEFDVIARTFLAVFPQASVWRDDFYPNRPVLGLIGQRGSRAVDLERVGERLERLPEWSRDPLLATPSGLVMLYAGDLAAARDLIPAGALNTDDRPLIEFMAPRLTRIDALGDKDWFTGDALAEWYDALDRRLAGNSDPLFPESPAVADARIAGLAMVHYALAASRHDDGAASGYEAEVRRLVPEVVASAESASVFAGGPEPHGLGGLRAEQDTMRRQLETMERRLGELTTHVPLPPGEAR